EDLDPTGVGIRREQLRGDLPERLRDLAVQMCLSCLFGFEGVEDAVRRIAGLERVPGDGSFLLRGELATAAQEVGERVAFSRLRLEESEDPERDCHDQVPLRWLTCLLTAPLHSAGPLSRFDPGPRHG